MSLVLTSDHYLSLRSVFSKSLPAMPFLFFLGAFLLLLFSALFSSVMHFPPSLTPSFPHPVPFTCHSFTSSRVFVLWRNVQMHDCLYCILIFPLLLLAISCILLQFSHKDSSFALCSWYYCNEYPASPNQAYFYQGERGGN